MNELNEVESLWCQVVFLKFLVFPWEREKSQIVMWGEWVGTHKLAHCIKLTNF